MNEHNERDTQPMIIHVVCTHCKQQVKMRKPSSPGYYKVVCPHCDKTFMVKQANRTAHQAESQGKAIVSCPKCLHPISFSPKKSGVYRITCPNDKHIFAIKVSLPTDGNSIENKEEEKKGKEIEKPQQNKTQPTDVNTTVCIVVQRNESSKLVFPLHEGHNIIGRPSETGMPDIAIPDDDTISRRSIDIETIPNPQGNGSFYRLTVLKASNPVLHNNKAIEVGKNVFLNYGDKITLGKTLLHFQTTKKEQQPT